MSTAQRRNPGRRSRHAHRPALGRHDRCEGQLLDPRPAAVDYTVTVAGKAPQTTTLQVGQSVTSTSSQARARTARSSSPAAGPLSRPRRRPSRPTSRRRRSRTCRRTRATSSALRSLAPGVTLSNPSGAQQFQVGALNADHSNILLDGMSFKNPVNHGGMFGQNFG